MPGPASKPAPTSGRAGLSPLRAIFLAVLLVVCANTLWFAIKVASPVLVSDGWHFVSSLILPYAHGDFSAGDLFAKRGPADHSQPLRKLLLLLNYEWFDLDFMFDAIVGVLAAFASSAILWLIAQRARAGREARPVELLVFLALAAAYLSLNSLIVFSWPLVTTSFTNHPFILLLAWAAWDVLERKTAWALVRLFAAALFLCIIADDTGLLSTIAVVLALIIQGVRRREIGSVLSASAVAGAACLTYAALYSAVSETPASGGVPPLRIAETLGVLGHDLGAVRSMAEAVLAGAVAHRSTLLDWFGHPLGITAVALVLAAAHLWFWVVALSGRRNLPSFVATFLMLLFYGLLAGLLLTRVTQYGADYFWQPRYSIFYRLSLVAILLMLLAQWVPKDRRHEDGTRQWAAPLLTGLAAVVLLVQIPISAKAWESVGFIEKYQRKQAMQIIEIARNPDVLPKKCMPGINVCQFPPSSRRQVMHFLEAQKLNVFNSGIRDRHGLGDETQSAR